MTIRNQPAENWPIGNAKLPEESNGQAALGRFRRILEDLHKLEETTRMAATALCGEMPSSTLKGEPINDPRACAGLIGELHHAASAIDTTISTIKTSVDRIHEAVRE